MPQQKLRELGIGPDLGSTSANTTYPLGITDNTKRTYAPSSSLFYIHQNYISHPFRCHVSPIVRPEILLLVVLQSTPNSHRPTNLLNRDHSKKSHLNTGATLCCLASIILSRSPSVAGTTTSTNEILDCVPRLHFRPADAALSFPICSQSVVLLISELRQEVIVLLLRSWDS